MSSRLSRRAHTLEYVRGHTHAQPHPHLPLAQAAKDEDIIAYCAIGNPKLPRESNDSVLVPEVK